MLPCVAEVVVADKCDGEVENGDDEVCGEDAEPHELLGRLLRRGGDDGREEDMEHEKARCEAGSGVPEKSVICPSRITSLHHVLQALFLSS
jgi:hypothetical protein